MAHQKPALNLNSNFSVEVIILKIILIITLLFLVTGFITPLVTLKKFLLIEHTFSVLSGTLELFTENQFFLFLLIFSFSIVIPLLKIAVLFKLLYSRETHKPSLHKFLHWMHLYGKWSMLDVFVVAVLVVTVKLGAIASVEIHYGMYFFSAAIILTMIITARIVKLAEIVEQNNLNHEPE